MAYTAPTFTTTATVNGNTKIQDVDSQVSTLIQDVTNYMNDNAGVAANLANNYKDDAAISANNATTAKDTAVSAKNEAVLAKDEIKGYVIPTNATYSPTTIKAIADMAETLNLTGAI